MATPAEAAPVFAGGLVNVNVTDIAVLNDVDVLRNAEFLQNFLNDNNVAVGVAANVAASVCNVNVGGILGELRTVGTYTCEAANTAGETLTITQAN